MSRPMPRPQEPARRELPSSVEFEQEVLGAILVNNATFASVSAILEPRYFCEEVHADIFDTMSAIILRGGVANPVSVKHQMKNPNFNIGGMVVGEYMARMARNAAGAYAAVSVAHRIKETYLRRCLIQAGEELIEIGHQLVEPEELSEESAAAQQNIAAISNDFLGKAEFYGASIADQYLTMITKESSASRNGDKSLRSGVAFCLDEIGTVLSERMFQPQHLYGLLSSSGEGKTSLTLQIIYQAIIDDNPCIFLSYDQTGTESVAQMVAQQYGYEVRLQKMGDLTEKQIERAYGLAQQIGKMRFQVVDCDSTKDTVSRLAAYARTFVKRNLNGRTPLIVIDHIGTIRPDPTDMKADEGTKARNIGQQLKSLAKELNAVVLVLQQRSGSGMKRINPRPIAADLFGGQVAMQPFDAIAYLYRAEHHMQSQLDIAQDARESEKIRARFQQQFGETENMAEIGALKVRFGSKGIRRKVEFEAKYTRYKSLLPEQEQESFFG